MSEETKILQAECGHCNGSRNCYVRGAFVERDSVDGSINFVANWRILQCCGCDYVFVQRSCYNDYDYERDEDGNLTYPETISYWPAQSKRQKPDWFDPTIGILAENCTELETSLVELYVALDNDILIFSAIGIRTCFDIASELLGVDPKKPFTAKIDQLIADKHIRESDRERLETLVEAGSASAHRGWRPKVGEISAMMDVLEHFISDAFVAPDRRKKLDAKAAKVKVSVPKRGSKKSTTNSGD